MCRCCYFCDIFISTALHMRMVLLRPCVPTFTEFHPRDNIIEDEIVEKQNAHTLVYSCILVKFFFINKALKTTVLHKMLPKYIF